MGVVPLQSYGAVELLRGVGAPVAKSAALLSVSVQPPPPRKIVRVFEGAGAGPLPSYAFAPDPYPTKSTSDANPAGLETVNTAMLFNSATLPAAVASASVPTTSAAGNGAPFAPPDASRIST